jgi:ribonuclease J
MSLNLTVHRGTQEIGGSCIELATAQGERLLLDAGRPLDAPRDAKDLLPATLDLSTGATVLFSHPHMDHWGLVEELPADWPIWTGSKSAELMRLTQGLFGGSIDREICTWTSQTKQLQIGPFTVTPYLTDHSGMDAYMLLIEACGQRIFYTGDFRTHGRKAKLVENLIIAPPPDIDVLVTEGTNLRSTKPTVSETELEGAFVSLAAATERHVFVQWSAQNVDRTVTLFRAARRTGRPLVIDLYAADVLERVSAGTGIPVPGERFPDLKVLILGSGKRLYARQKREDYVTRMATSPFAVSRRSIAETPAIIMLRDSMLNEFERGGLGFTPRDAYVFSSWSGYLDPQNEKSGWARASAAGTNVEQIHTSGHASPEDIARFAAAIAPKAIVPVHGLSWDDPGILLPPLKRLQDGESWKVGK